MITYNPYIPQVSILINGMPPNDFSRLIQYSDEDVWQWSYELFDTIYEEIRDEFVVEFTGRHFDSEILRYFSQNNSHCIGFVEREFLINDSIQKRMGELNQIIKKNNISNYKRTIIEAYFYISDTFYEYLNDIQELDIKNLFCKVKPIIIDDLSLYKDLENSVLFILSDDIEHMSKKIMNYEFNNFTFIVLLSDKKQIFQVTKNVCVIQTREEELFDTLFECFMQIPLLIAFRNCHVSIDNKNEITRELKKVVSIEPIIDIVFDEILETGKSNKIYVKFDPPLDMKPRLSYKVLDTHIATCDGLNIYGIQKGNSRLEVYQYGSKKPFFSKEFRVIERNRITKIVLSENTVSMGISDRKRILCNYFPENADNADLIQWKSSDEKIAKIDNNGNISALSEGNCRIICLAENISSQSVCVVKPYLEDIKINSEFEKDNLLQIQQQEEFDLMLECIPENSIDSKIVVTSSDLSVVNVVNGKLYGKKVGKATVTISNSSNRITKVIDVKVVKKRKSIFSSLFK